MAKKKYTVTPWEVRGDVDYEALIKEFGTKPINNSLLKKIEKNTGELHPFLKRKHFFSHRDLDLWLKDYEKGKKVYLYTGRAPSGPVHIGHLIPWIFTKYLQDKFEAPLLFQIPDEEKYLFKEGLSLEDTNKWAYENILDIIAVGFDEKKTDIFLDTEYAKTMYKTAVEVSKKITYSTAKAVFGFNNSANIGSIFYTSMQSVPAFLPTIREGKPTKCLIPHAIDQDPHFRVARDVAPKLNYPKPCSVHCKFLPSLRGADEKMSASGEHTAIYVTDDEETVKKKINKYAFSGGGETVEEHRKKGGNPDIDVSYQWLTFFEEDGKKLKEIYNDYKNGDMLTGELKAILIEKLNKFLKEHRKKREKAKKKVDKFILRD
ncbi:MAG: tryptophan--tRNA ligase [Candidatus Undinarchaeales archaeon]